MSETIILNFNEFIESRKAKIIDILVSEITFLKSNLKEAKNKDDMDHFSYALEKLGDILIKLKQNSSHMQKKDFDEIIKVIYQLFKDISMNIE